ncbi:MAG: MopE-related protein [Myxococcota bacterium]
MRRMLVILALATACATDADGDGVSATEDCNDADAAIFPGNSEICDGKDNNCDGTIDEGVTDTFFNDTDRDGFGDPASSVEACDADTNQVENGDDCDDSQPDAFPGNDEKCDGFDNNCNDTIDEGSAIDASDWYQDSDDDGYGDTTQTRRECDPGAGWSLDDGDCDDADPDVNPGADEVCFDGIDNNCDEAIDEATAVDSTRWYRDADTDLFGNPDVSELGCEAPDGYVADNTDCDDADKDEQPGALWYPDADSDSYGQEDATGNVCERLNPTDVNNNEDCLDDNPGANPGETEIWYNDVDNDCDGESDFDQDGDTYDSSAELEGGNDCDDLNAAISPIAREVQDGVDNNCDALCDEGFIAAGDLIITEIMQNPAFSDDKFGEYFEVYNDSGFDIVMCDGWEISDDGADSHTITGGPVTIAKDDWFVFGVDADTTANGGVTVDYEYSSFLLSNGADEVVLSFDGTEIDRVDYDGGSDFPDPTGASMNLDPDNRDDSDNDDGSLWCEADSEITSGGDYGTPGAANDECPEESFESF